MKCSGEDRSVPPTRRTGLVLVRQVGVSHMIGNGQGDTPPRLRVSQAAKAVGRSRASLHRDIAAGRVSVTRNGTGQPFIEIAELERAYGRVELATVSHSVAVRQDATAENRPEIVALQRELALLREERERERQDAQATITDLRHRLDAEAEERRRA